MRDGRYALVRASANSLLADRQHVAHVQNSAIGGANAVVDRRVAAARRLVDGAGERALAVIRMDMLVPETCGAPCLRLVAAQGFDLWADIGKLLTVEISCPGHDIGGLGEMPESLFAGLQLALLGRDAFQNGSLTPDHLSVTQLVGLGKGDQGGHDQQQDQQRAREGAEIDLEHRARRRGEGDGDHPVPDRGPTRHDIQPASIGTRAKLRLFSQSLVSAVALSRTNLGGDRGDGGSAVHDPCIGLIRNGGNQRRGVPVIWRPGHQPGMRRDQLWQRSLG